MLMNYQIELTDQEIAVLLHFMSVYQYEARHKFPKEIRNILHNIKEQAIDQKVLNQWTNHKLIIDE